MTDSNTNQTQSTKHEIRNKHKAQNSKEQNNIQDPINQLFVN
jgi:hypothetical protein